MEFPFRIVRVAQYGVLKWIMLLWTNEAFMTRETTKCFEICHKRYLSCHRQFSVNNMTLSSHIMPLHMCQNITERDLALVIASFRMKCFYLKIKLYRKITQKQCEFVCINEKTLAYRLLQDQVK